VQKLLLKLGSEAAKKINPITGLIFAGVGLAQSIDLTYKLVTQKFPKQDAERIVATLLAGNILAVLLAARMPAWAKKAREDESGYFKMTPEEQANYDRGQSILPKADYEKIQNLSPTEKGEHLADLSGLRRVVQYAQGVWELSANTIRGGFGFGQWLGTGLTPELYQMLGTNGASVQALAAVVRILFSQIKL
jgi:hypothetical protein